MRGQITEEQSYSLVDSLMVEACKEIMDYAQPRGVDVVIEAIDRSETNYLKTAAEVLELIQKVNCDHLKVHLDTFHMNIEELDWTEPVLLCGQKLGHVHVADNTRLYPGSGMIDFIPFLKALRTVHYNRSLVMEIYPGKDGFRSCLLGKEYLMECFKAIADN